MQFDFFCKRKQEAIKLAVHCVLEGKFFDVIDESKIKVDIRNTTPVARPCSCLWLSYIARVIRLCACGVMMATT